MSKTIERLTAALSDRYVIERELGEGGMATVYLADDLKHDRKVALKVLKPELAAVVGADRFLAEIKTTANLQHPNILPLFDSGEAEGFLFYVMPYVEGESLRERLDREKQLPVEESVRIASEVADALQSAHEQGVIHRDIKPANILLSRGRPLVADFGIALAVSAAGGGRLTETGLSLGTPYYMSPEQASADRDPSAASDVYSLACVLYEMLVGEPPHTGGSAQAVLVKILTGDAPAPTEARPTIPPNVDAAIRRALEKLPADRFAGTQDFAKALRNSAFRFGEEGAAPPVGTRGLRGLSIAAITVATAVVALALGWWLGQRSAPASVESGEVVRFPLSVPGEYESTVSNEVPSLAISPDGRVIVYREGGILMRRVLAEEGAEPIPGTEGAGSPFFSPDGMWIGFLLDGSFIRISANGVASSVGNTSIDWVHGVDWGEDDSIVYGRSSRGIWSISVHGGQPEPLTDPSAHPGEQGHLWPQSLADGSLLLYSAIGPSGNWHDSKIVLKNLEAGARTTVVEGAAYGRYVPTGHIVYATEDGTIHAVAFDLETRQSGPSVPIEADVLLGQWGGGAAFVVSPSGTLVFARGDNSQRHLLEWYNRSGDRLGQLGPPMTVAWGLEIDPLGGRVAASLPDNRNDDIHLLEDGMVTPRKITSGPGADGWPVWSPDGSRIAWQRDVDGRGTVAVQVVDGVGEPVDVYTSQGQVWPRSWSGDGRWLAISVRTGESGMDLVAVDMEDPSNVVSVLDGPGTEWDAHFSPDGKYIGFDSNESGPYQTYVTSFPPSGDPLLVFTGKSQHPRWSPTRNELYFWSDTTLMAARFRTDPRFVVEDVRELFSVGDYVISDDPYYDVHPDGERFLIQVHNPDAAVRELHVVLNWLEVVKQRAGH